MIAHNIIIGEMKAAPNKYLKINRVIEYGIKD